MAHYVLTVKAPAYIIDLQLSIFAIQ